MENSSCDLSCVIQYKVGRGGQSGRPLEFGLDASVLPDDTEPKAPI